MERYLMIENGIIYKVTRGGYAIVRLSRKTACENCKMCLMPRKEMYVQVRIRNTEGLKEGEYVSIVMPDSAVLKSAFLVYLLPILVMTVVLGLTYKLELWISLIATISSVIVVFAGVALLDKYILKKLKGFSPSMSKACQISKEEQKSLESLIMGREILYEDDLGKYSLKEKNGNTRDKEN
jgi:sigma-E factor negative regulatory protein RseC